MQLKALEIKTQGDNYIVQAWNRGISASRDLEKHYTPDEIRKLEIEGRQKRQPGFVAPNLLSLSQLLRLAGNFVDRARGRLIRISWQDQSDKIQALTIQYEPFESERKEQGEPQLAVMEELCVHVYKQKKKIATGSDKSAHRPLVNVGNAR